MYINFIYAAMAGLYNIPEGYISKLATSKRPTVIVKCQ